MSDSLIINIECSYVDLKPTIQKIFEYFWSGWYYFLIQKKTIWYILITQVHACLIINIECRYQLSKSTQRSYIQCYQLNIERSYVDLEMWLLGFEPKSPRPQRGILTTKLQPQLKHKFQKRIKHSSELVVHKKGYYEFKIMACFESCPST